MAKNQVALDSLLLQKGPATSYSVILTLTFVNEDLLRALRDPLEPVDCRVKLALDKGVFDIRVGYVIIVENLIRL